MKSKISINELISIINQANIIDIRSVQSYNNNHIPNSINIPFDKLILNPDQYLNKNNIYYIYCQKGLSSGSICRILDNLGYKIIEIDGGYENWIMNVK